MDKHHAEMMNGGMDVDETMVNSRWKKMAKMRNCKTQ
jgi:hypothetical protein